ncbi:MAG TPA: hypothetical protein VGG79_01650 [Roseiarcus sp.]|jgi:hypothetical protein
MRRRVEAGEPALSGMFTRAEVTYAWPREDGTVGSDREPVALFTGEAVHAYLVHLSDAAGEAMLNELAAELGAALGQARIYVAFGDRTWILDAAEHARGTRAAGGHRRGPNALPGTSTAAGSPPVSAAGGQPNLIDLLRAAFGLRRPRQMARTAISCRKSEVELRLPYAGSGVVGRQGGTCSAIQPSNVATSGATPADGGNCAASQLSFRA